MIRLKTDKYTHMISAFQCDFSLAKNNPKILNELQENLESKDERFIKDIELLEEFEYKLRHGIIEIYEVL